MRVIKFLYEVQPSRNPLCILPKGHIECWRIWHQQTLMSADVKCVSMQCVPFVSATRASRYGCGTYHQTSNIRRTGSLSLNASRLVLQLPLHNPSKPGVKLRIKILEQQWQAMLQLHLSDQHLYYLLTPLLEVWGYIANALFWTFFIDMHRIQVYILEWIP